MEEVSWEVDTYMRILRVIGGAENDEQVKRARNLLEEFKHHFPQAKPMWDAYCEAKGIA